MTASTEREEGFREGVDAAAKVCQQEAERMSRTEREFVAQYFFEAARLIRALTPPTDGAEALLRECLGWLRESYAPEIDDLRNRIYAHLSGKDRG